MDHLRRGRARPLPRQGHRARATPATCATPGCSTRPYRLEREGRELAIVFRDHTLSDLIGFTYQIWDPRDAAANLVWRLRTQIRRNLAGSDRSPIW